MVVWMVSYDFLPTFFQIIHVKSVASIFAEARLDRLVKRSQVICDDAVVFHDIELVVRLESFVGGCGLKNVHTPVMGSQLLLVLFENRISKLGVQACALRVLLGLVEFGKAVFRRINFDLKKFFLF